MTRRGLALFALMSVVWGIPYTGRSRRRLGRAPSLRPPGAPEGAA